MSRHTRVLGGTAAALLLCAGLAGCGSEESSAAPALNLKPVQSGSLTVCTSPPYEPFEFDRGGEIVGFDIDLVNAVAAQLDLTPVVVNADFDDIQSGESLNSGECDVAIAGMTITGDRAKVLDFS